jgi:hypothetical protein
MGGPAGLDADLHRRQLAEELGHLPAPQLLAQHRLFRRVHPMQHKNALGRVDANADKIVHGRLPRLRSATTSFWHTDAVGGRPPQQ